MSAYKFDVCFADLTGYLNAIRVAKELARDGRWVAITPLPDDVFRVSVKDESRHRLEELVDGARRQEERQAGAIDAILQSADTERALAGKTDAEIAALLLEHVWQRLPLFSAHSDLIDEAIERLKRSGAGKREIPDEDGE